MATAAQKKAKRKAQKRARAPRAGLDTENALSWKARLSWDGEFDPHTLRRVCSTNLTYVQLKVFETLAFHWRIEVTAVCEDYEHVLIRYTPRGTMHHMDPVVMDMQKEVKSKINEKHLIRMEWKMRRARQTEVDKELHLEQKSRRKILRSG